ncbi:MAG: hypothetical protein QOE69_1679 [Thermoleophilaceae bacterium]|nr:hypothetical protein [Thermoleophilaceae bacterium]
MAQDLSSAVAPVVPGVGFEVDRFEWTADDRLELVGRWFGLRGHRFLRPTLDVQVADERRRMLADLEHKPWAANEGEPWTAVFSWRGAPAHFEEAELTVAPDLAVPLPVPENGVEEAAVTNLRDRLPARRPRTAVLESELAVALAEAERLTDELARVRAGHEAAVDDLRERLEAERARARGLESELDGARQALEAAKGAEAAATEAAAAATAEVDPLRTERDDAVAARDEALAKLAAAEAENAAVAEQRDKAREERNVWMSRADAAATRPLPEPDAEPDADATAPLPLRVATPASRRPVALPEPPTRSHALPDPARPGALPDPPARPGPSPDRRTIQIGERPGPPPARPIVTPGQPGIPEGFLEAWGARLAALGVLLLLLAAVAVLVLLVL